MSTRCRGEWISGSGGHIVWGGNCDASPVVEDIYLGDLELIVGASKPHSAHVALAYFTRRDGFVWDAPAEILDLLEVQLRDLGGIRAMLLAKNAAYGDSALNPVRAFSA